MAVVIASGGSTVGTKIGAAPKLTRTVDASTRPATARRLRGRLSVMTKLPRPRADLSGFPAYRTQQQKADVRLQANEWAEPNRAGRWLTPDELDAILLNRYPGAAVELRTVLAER